MTNVILIAIIALLVAIIIPLAFDDGKRRGEYKEYVRAREEIKEMMENV